MRNHLSINNLHFTAPLRGPFARPLQQLSVVSDRAVEGFEQRVNRAGHLKARQDAVRSGKAKGLDAFAREIILEEDLFGEYGFICPEPGLVSPLIRLPDTPHYSGCAYPLEYAEIRGILREIPVGMNILRIEIREQRLGRRPHTHPLLQLLGSAIGMKVMEEVPYVKGMEQWLGTELNDENRAYLKDFGAATASNGAVGLYHIAGLTPEAKEQGESLIAENAQVYVVDDAELQRVKNNYPVIWKNPEARPQLCFVGCPHMTMQQLKDWTDAIGRELRKTGHSKVTVPTVFTAPAPVIREFEQTMYGYRLRKFGVVLSYICPLMYMNNPLCKRKAVITSSNKLRTYTSARYYTEAEILTIITGGTV